MRDTGTPCPVCGRRAEAGVYGVRGVPTRTASVYADPVRTDVARGDIELASCDGCGLIFNRMFDPATQDFSLDYEEAQDFSPTFKGYTFDLATRLAERYQLRGKRVVEIGCGKGGFLATLCRVAGATGVGIDPAADPARLPAEVRDRVTVVKAEYGEAHRRIVEEADFICCRHTLEHIFDPITLLGRLRDHLGPRDGVPFVADVPAGAHVFDVGGFWDVYYEHCMYYTDEAFAAMLRRAGFRVERVRREYAGQYLVAEAFPGERAPASPGSGQRGFEGGATLARGGRLLAAKRDAWGAWLDGPACSSRVALWGSGSRAVGFLGSVPGAAERIDGVVDINPHRAGRYMPGFSRAIQSPVELASAGCEAIVVMNPVYREEIAACACEHGINAEILTVDDPPGFVAPGSESIP